MVNYVSSCDITVFPSVGRGNFDYNARNLNEYSLSSIINKAFGAKSFVVNGDEFTSFADNSTLKFNIDGYFFELSNLPSDLPSFNYIWAGIKIEDYKVTIGNKEVNYKELSTIGSENSVNDEESPLDIGNTFYGLFITATNSSDEPSVPPNPTGLSWLLILKRNGENIYTVPDESKAAFDASRVDFSNVVVDGGVIQQT